MLYNPWSFFTVVNHKASCSLHDVRDYHIFLTVLKTDLHHTVRSLDTVKHDLVAAVSHFQTGFENSRNLASVNSKLRKPLKKMRNRAMTKNMV